MEDHVFTNLEILQALHEFKVMMIKHFGEIYIPKSDTKFKGKAWDCKSMVSLDAGLWRLVQAVKHSGAKWIFGKIEVRDVGTTLRCIAFYEPEQKQVEDRKIIVPGGIIQ